VDALRARAAQFDTFARRGLGRFLRFIQGLSEAGLDPSAGISLSPGEDAVRVLSIHKSKGLEFPVVCLADLSHRFNLGDLYRAVVTDREWLIGMKRPTARRSVTLPSLSHEVVSEHRRRAMLAEELRLLYVGMTRAREHLILSSAVSNPEGMLERWGLWEADSSETLPEFLRLGATSHLDWLGPALAGQSVRMEASEPRAVEGIGEGRPAAPFVVRVVETVEIPGSEEKPGKGDTGVSGNEEKLSLEALDRVLTLRPAPLPEGLRAKLSVTEIKRMWEYAHEPEDRGPGFVAAGGGGKDPYALALLEPETAQHESMSAAERGTLTHLVLQHLDFARCDGIKSIRAQIDELSIMKAIPAEVAGQVDLDALDWLLGTEIGRALREQPDRIRRELAFTAWLPAVEVYPVPGTEERERLGEDRIVVQGVIDCLVVGDRNLRLIDYKTDAVTGEALDRRAASYGTQLRLYARAAAEVYSRPVSEASLVFLHPREIRRVDLG
jgi:ATP-dependent helicase/nuclease subunit A